MATDNLQKDSVREGEEQFSVDPVVLADVEVSFVFDEHSFLFPCQVVERLAPEPGVTLEYDGNPEGTLERSAIRTLLKANRTEIQATVNSGTSTVEAPLFVAFPTSFGVAPGSHQGKFYLAKDLTEQHCQRMLQEVSFSIINMNIISSTGLVVESKKEFRVIGGITLQDNEWTIQIRKSP